MNQTILTATKKYKNGAKQLRFKLVVCRDCGRKMIRRRNRKTCNLVYCVECSNLRRATNYATYVHSLDTEE